MGFRKITEEIFQVGGAGLTAPDDAAVYLIRSKEHAAVVDAGCGRSIDGLFENVASCGVRPRDILYLLITHCHYDHTGGARAFGERTGCRIIAHEKDAAFLERGDNTVTAASWYGARIEPFQVERKLSLAEESIALGDKTISAIHTPGHSPGSVVYLTESDGKKVLFAQDVHGPLHPSLLSDETLYVRSLHRLLTIKADILCEGHYGVFFGRKEIERFIRSFLP